MGESGERKEPAEETEERIQAVGGSSQAAGRCSFRTNWKTTEDSIGGPGRPGWAAPEARLCGLGPQTGQRGGSTAVRLNRMEGAPSAVWVLSEAQSAPALQV